jgi:prepilin-type N-terminal cleavage/methylation domain-containing protein
MSFFSTQSVKYSSGFTLPELIIVVAILVTLGTIAFASYSEYTVSSRDAKRSSDLVVVRGNLSAYSVKNGGYPKPANYVEVRATAATGSTVLLRQGMIDSTLATTLDIAGGGRDPSTNQGYTLSVDANGKRAQVLAYFEKSGSEAQLSARFPNLFENAYAEDIPLTDKFPVSTWEKLWTFLQGNTLIPLEQTQTGSIALPTLSGSGFMVVGGCLTTERMTSVATAYPEGLYEGPCEYIPYMSSVTNSMGQDGDEMVAYDNRAYNHPATVVAANGGNPDFFDKRYKLLKMKGRWWTNQNMIYPSSSVEWTHAHGWVDTINPICPPNATLSAKDCLKVPTMWYIYQKVWAQLVCPSGWTFPSPGVLTEWINDENSWTKSSYLSLPKFTDMWPWAVDWMGNYVSGSYWWFLNLGENTTFSSIFNTYFGYRNQQFQYVWGGDSRFGFKMRCMRE